MLLSFNGRVNIRKYFKVNEFVDTIFCRKTGGVVIGFMFVNSANQIVCYAGIKRDIAVIGKDIDKAVHIKPFLKSGDTDCHVGPLALLAMTGQGKPIGFSGDLSPHQLVQRHLVKVRQADQDGQLRLPLATFIILISAERNTDFICDCCLGQMPVFSKLYKAVRKVGQNKIPP